MSDRRKTMIGVGILVGVPVFVLLSVAVWLGAFTVGAKLVLQAVILVIAGILLAWGLADGSG